MKIKSPAREDASIDMAPMIDLVFLLLIFFMVASVVTELNKVTVAIPKSAHAKPPDDTKGRMMLSIDANEQIYYNTLPVTIEELKPLIEEELELNPDLRILIRADERVEYKVCKDLMIACGEVGATDLIYATFQE
jgi:biopolymer transport protein ExbD